MNGMSKHDSCSAAIVVIHIVITAHSHNMCVRRARGKEEGGKG